LTSADLHFQDHLFNLGANEQLSNALSMDENDMQQSPYPKFDRIFISEESEVDVEVHTTCPDDRHKVFVRVSTLFLALCADNIQNLEEVSPASVAMAANPF
jgi:hypothetical protein